MGHFRHDGQRLAYEVHGEGTWTTVLMPGLLLSQKMQTPLAHQLAKRGNRVITFDPLGHGASDRPRDMWRYSMPAFAEQTIALLDHLELDQAIVGGTSLGANITLEVAALAPQRLRGMIIEMPVLDNAIPACAAVFTPLLFALTFGEPVMAAVARAAQRLYRWRLPLLLELAVDAVAQDPGPGGAVLQGIIFGRTAPDRSQRRTFEAPALIIGHPRDPVHPFSDADMLAGELPKRPPAARQLDHRAAHPPGPADRADRAVRRRMLERGAGTSGSKRRGLEQGQRGLGGPGGSMMSRPVGLSRSSSSSCQK